VVTQNGVEETAASATGTDSAFLLSEIREYGGGKIAGLRHGRTDHGLSQDRDACTLFGL
jgi:hypothetical protein